jgi:hypothetical protein
LQIGGFRYVEQIQRKNLSSQRFHASSISSLAMR